MHEMKCQDFLLHYKHRQTDRQTELSTLGQENINMRNHNSNSRYSNFMLNMNHAYGTIMNTIDIMKTSAKEST
jgi:hypothetical protein